MEPQLWASCPTTCKAHQVPLTPLTFCIDRPDHSVLIRVQWQREGPLMCLQRPHLHAQAVAGAHCSASLKEMSAAVCAFADCCLPIVWLAHLADAAGSAGLSPL